MTAAIPRTPVLCMLTVHAVHLTFYQPSCTLLASVHLQCIDHISLTVDSVFPTNTRACARTYTYLHTLQADDGTRDFLTDPAGKRARNEGEPDDEPPDVNPDDEFDWDEEEGAYHDAMAVEEHEISIPEHSKKRWCRSVFLYTYPVQGYL